MAATEAAKEAVHLRRLHAELTFEDNPPPTRLHLDNMGAIDTAYNHAHHSRMKHCDRKVFGIRELVEDHKIVVPFVESDKNIADFPTKPPRQEILCHTQSHHERMLAWHADSSHRQPHAPRLGGCHAQTTTLLIFVAIACNFHEAPLLPFFLYRSTPKFPPLYLT